ncbi:sensor histidine kinase [Actinospongicola halichondriae]|uniref:sensor histidine kinase n=1 Tax=Actinospongicola halichondriae TaxID=3236844 RepID=UPI003D386EFA
MSTARRIQLGILLTVFIVMVTCGVGILVTVRSELVDQIDDQLETGAETLGRLDDPIDALGLVETVAMQPDRESALLVFGPSGDLVASVSSGTGEGDALPDIGRVGITGLQEREGRTIQLPAVDDSVEYRVVAVEVGDSVLVIASPLDEVHDTMGRVTVALMVAAGFAVAAIGVVTTIVIRRAISPIDDMIDTAAAIGDGDLSHRIDTSSHDPEVLRLSGALNDMLHQIEDAFAEKETSERRLRQFVADASHELRTPLSSIRGYSELYLTGAATDEHAVGRAMTRIQSEAIRTGGLVEDLLLLARLDQGREIQREEVDLTRVVSDAVADAKAIEPERDLALALPDQSVSLLGDEGRLRQVVTNLLANTRAHAPGTRVEVQLMQDGGVVTLVVRDEGPGLDDDQAARVFDRFWRADETRNRRTGGSGLGLSIIESIVEAHGGTIELETAPGQGATFSVWLPIRGGVPEP